MFCPSCGFQYTQKSNYCKSCGENLGNPEAPNVSRPPRMMLAGAFWAVAALGLFGLINLLSTYRSMWNNGARNADLYLPFMLGCVLIGAIAGLMVWQVSRLISAYFNLGQDDRPIVRQAMREPPQQIAAPIDQIGNVAERPSVAEHTTRQFANVHREPTTRE